MKNAAISKQGLERRYSQLSELQRRLLRREEEFAALHQQVQGFVDRYIEALSASYLELDALESQLHCALHYLAEALRGNGIAVRSPKAPQATVLPILPRLPQGAPLLPEPCRGGWVELAPPPLKTLFRRAAMRLHPDFARSDADRQRREQSMLRVNQAFAAGDRAQLEALLLASGENPVRVTSSNAEAQRHWLTRSEHAVQGRLRVVQAYLLLLNAHPMHQLWRAIDRAESIGLNPLGVMALRLRSQIEQLRRELYIGQRLKAKPALAQAFLRRRVELVGAAATL